MISPFGHDLDGTLLAAGELKTENRWAARCFQTLVEN